jgi:4-aminobutyrate aminotransferase-like enzyme
MWRQARGAWVEDARGRRFLDFTSGLGVAALGHSPPAVVRAVRRQALRLTQGFGDLHPHELRATLAHELSEIAPWPAARVLWAQGGSEAVELALKTALLATGRAGVLAFRGGYHGDSIGALEVSGFPAFRRPFAALLAGRTVWAHYPHCARCPLGLRYPSCRTACVKQAFEDADRFAHRGARVGAVLLEPVLGRGGVVVPPPGALRAVRRAARERGWVYIADETFTGLGRTGRLFAWEHDGARPDLLCVGKALGGGLPLAAVLGPKSLLTHWRRAASGGEAAHSATFLAHPLACAAALATLSALRRGRVVARVARRSRSFLAALRALARRHPRVVEVRGLGFLAGLDLSPRTGERPASGGRAGGPASRVMQAAGAEGLLVLSAGLDGSVVQLAPPLTVENRLLADGIERLDRALERAARS